MIPEIGHFALILALSLLFGSGLRSGLPLQVLLLQQS